MDRMVCVSTPGGNDYPALAIINGKGVFEFLVSIKQVCGFWVSSEYFIESD
jgi:hypothetical protein